MQHDTTPRRADKIGIQINRIPALRDNYIWCLADGRTAWVIDPGEAAPVLAHLQQHQLTLAGVLLTHHHADHVGGVAELLAVCEGAESLPVYGPAVEEIAVTRQPLWGGESLGLLGQTCQVLNVAAHTRGHLAYYLPELNALFCGDALFGAGCGRLFEGTPQQLAQVMAQLRALPEATAIYCAHEYTQMNLPFAQAIEPQNRALAERVQRVAVQRSQGLPTVPLSLAEECATNPFLRWDEPVVIQAVQEQLVGEASPAAVLGALRGWRDHF